MCRTVHSSATKEATCFIHFKSNVVDAAGITEEAANKFFDRITAAFDMGEPVWMIAEEIKLRAAAPSKHKTPKQLAARFITAA